VARQIIEAVRSGDIERFQREQRMYTVEARDVVDENQYFQSLLFTATTINDQDKSIKMLSYLIENGVDPMQRDNLKQTPVFYAARDGKVNVLQFLID
jgi:ankyrin repeat protein